MNKIKADFKAKSAISAFLYKKAYATCPLESVGITVSLSVKQKNGGLPLSQRAVPSPVTRSSAI